MLSEINLCKPLTDFEIVNCSKTKSRDILYLVLSRELYGKYNFNVFSQKKYIYLLLSNLDVCTNTKHKVEQMYIYV